MLRVALKDILARKRRLVTTGLAVVLGVAFLTGTNMLSSTLKDSISTIFVNAYSGYDAVVRSPEEQDLGFGQSIHPPVSASIEDQVARISGVESAMGVVEVIGPQLIDADGKPMSSGFGPPTIVYNWAPDDSLRAGKVTDGRGPLSDDEIMLDFTSAERAGYSVGDEVTVAADSGTHHFKLVGLVGLGADGKIPTGATTLILTTPEAQQLGRIPGQFSYIAASAEPGLAPDALASAISAALPKMQVLTGAEFTAENQESVTGIIDILSTFVTAFGYIALFVAGFIIYNTFSILVAQRTRETALLRAVGAARRQVLIANVLEALLVGVVASLIGLAVGTALAAGLRSAITAMFSVATTQTVPDIRSILSIVGIGTGVSVVSSSIPAYRSSRIRPIAALSDTVIEHGSVSIARAAWGGGLLVVGVLVALAGFAEIGPNHLLEFGLGAACVLIAVSLVLGPMIVGPAFRVLQMAMPFRRGIVLRLALGNATRNAHRTAATAAALTIGVSLVSLIAILANSIRASVDQAVSTAVTSDFVVTGNATSIGSGIPAPMVAQMQGLDGVAVASPMRFGPFRLSDEYGIKHASTQDKSPVEDLGIGATGSAPKGQDEFVTGVEPDRILELLDFGEISGSAADLTGDTIAVSRQVADERGWRLGDKIPVYFARTGTTKLKVAMIFEKESPIGSFFIPADTFQANMLSLFNVDYLVLVKASDSTATAQLRQQLDKIVKPLPTVTVQDISQYVEAQTGPFDTFLKIVYALLLLAVIIALIGIMNTLSLSILERTRELGLLRAVGMSKRQLRASIFGESVLIAVFGTLVGLALGLVFSAAMSRVIAAENPELFSYTVPAATLSVIALGAVAAGIVAAVVPAWRASRMEVLKAIASV